MLESQSGMVNERWPEPDHELSRAHRVANDSLQPEDMDWLCRGFSAFLASEGKLPLERCLRLPTNERALRRARRDNWLRCAWRQLEGEASSWRRSERLAVEVRRFRSLKWPRWSGLDRLPAEATELESVLFEAFHCRERVPGTAMQLHNIAAHREARSDP